MLDLNKLLGAAISYNPDTGKPDSLEMITPLNIVNEMLDTLPDEVWNKNSRFLDIACKSGNFLREIYVRLFNHPRMIAEFPDNTYRKEYILNNQLYGIAITKLSQLVSTRNVYGYICDSNIHYIENWSNIVKNKDSRFLVEKIKETFGDMQFNVVVGNPPYNDTETKVSTAIYSKFTEHAINISSKLVLFIIPARWYCGGRGLNNFRTMMMGEKHIRTLVDFENELDVFDSVSIAGGVCYFLYDKEYNGECRMIERKQDVVISDTSRDLGKYEVIIRNAKALKIIEKIREVNKSDAYLNLAVQAVDYFGIKDNLCVRDYKKSDDDIRIIDSTGVLYAERRYINDDKNLIDSYNVLVTHAVGGEGYVIPKTIRVLEKGEACSVTYLCVGAATTKEIANNLMKHIKTRFCRFLMNQAISGINISAKSFMFVPLERYGEVSDIDWSQSIPDIEKQLYAKYGLSQEEIDYIESTIKPMS